MILDTAGFIRSISSDGRNVMLRSFEYGYMPESILLGMYTGDTRAKDILNVDLVRHMLTEFVQKCGHDGIYGNSDFFRAGWVGSRRVKETIDWSAL